MQAPDDKVNILLVDDQPAKLMSYEVILGDLGENLIIASSAREALEVLLKTDVAVLLVDVCMPDLDGFELAAMVRDHPRFQKTAIIFISAIMLSEVDSLRGYEMGAVDYVPVPIVPELLRAKVRVFVDLYRKTKQLEFWNAELERRVAERTEELEQATKRQELLAREVDHRAKNALAVVQSIVRLTRADSVENFSRAVHGRIRAMANAHALLSASRWAGASLAQLVDEELSPFQAGARTEASGPAVTLRPAAAQAVAMALHELATNAAKYGSLSVKGGVVAVSWRVRNDVLIIEWSEFGGPMVKAPPERVGFGAKVIEASIAEQLSGDVHLEWRPQGLRCVLTIGGADGVADWRVEGENMLEAAEPSAVAPGVSAGSTLRSRRILVVEDEPLIAMMIADILEDEGAAVVGPLNSLDAALACDAPYDIALLDVNLSGVATYPLAERMRAEGRPFVFATGYDESSVDPRFAGAPVLQKPIDPSALVLALAGALTPPVALARGA